MTSVTANDLPAATPAMDEDGVMAAADKAVFAALKADKRDGLLAAVRARWIALGVIAILLPTLNPAWEVIYYEALLCAFAAIGWAQMRIGRVGRSRPEIVLIVGDLALLTFVLAFPNPFSDRVWPLAAQFHFDNFVYFFVLLAGATLAYSWRTMVAYGVWTTVLWLSAVAWMAWQPLASPELSQAIKAAFAGDGELFALIDPADVHWPNRIQEVVVFLIVAGILALNGWRSNRLLLRHAGVERERANLARYFSPNVVDELSHNDEPLKRVRTQDVAVLFADIVDFTSLSAAQAPEQVIRTLRDFHGRMEREVFRHHGTLDKYLGDGLMATFGTPVTTSSDAGNALYCARAMVAAMAAWNDERRARGETAIRVGFGVHYGTAVLGDIGANRLEFAVIGDTVNVASRLEALTRTLDAALVVSNALVEQVRHEANGGQAGLEGLEAAAPQAIRGLREPIAVWTLKTPVAVGAADTPGSQRDSGVD